MLTRIKESFQKFVAGLAQAAHGLGFTPNAMSALGLALSLVSAAAFYVWGGVPRLVPLAGVLFLLSGLCDALDGVMAKIYDEATVFGGILDSVIDRVSEAAVFLTLILGGLCEPLWGLLALVGSYLVSYTRSRAEAAGVPMETVGIAERAERIFILAGASFLVPVFGGSMNYGAGLIGLLSFITFGQRLVHAWERVSRRAS
jgi:archaetidylinositol phosphate synthase